MTNYYYSSNPDVEHKEKKWNFELLGNNIYFTTDNGVFSKNTVDFGTRVLLETIDANLDLDNKKILDMGCGYGPIGLSIAKAYPNSQVDMVDVNELALEIAKKNAANNNINNVKIFKSSQYEDINETDYDLIITNPPIRAGKDVVHGILAGSKQHLNLGGSIVAVIQKKQGAPSAIKKLNEVFENCQTLNKKKGYFILQSEMIK